MKIKNRLFPAAFGLSLAPSLAPTLALLLALSLVGTVNAAELKFAHFVPPQHTITASVIEPLSEGVAAATGGALTIRTYPGGELGKGPIEQYVRAVQGVADITFGLQGYTSSQFQKSMLAELPGAVPANMAGYDLLWNAFDEHLKSEYPATKPLALWLSERNVLIMKDKQIRTPADMAGLKIRVAGAVAADVVTALGATPVQMSIPQVYNALQTGLIDGVVTGSSAIADFKLHEVARSYTVGAPLGRIAFYVVMNQKAYDGLPDDQKAAIDANSGIALSRSAEDAWNAKGYKALDNAKANSENAFIELTEDEAKAFADITLAVQAKVVKELAAEEVLSAMQGN